MEIEDRFVVARGRGRERALGMTIKEELYRKTSVVMDEF